MNNYLDDLDSQITDKRTEHNKATDEIQANTEFVKNWGQIEGLLEEPTEERQTRLNTYIQKLESESKVQITNYGTFSEKPVEGHLKFRLLSLDKLRFSCNLESLVEILTRLDTDDQRLLRITQIRINVAASSPSVVAAARLEPEIPGVAPMDLTVEMAISIPIAVPDESAVDGREN
ncbi:MAG: hypothetical protein GY869_24005 [Planctomycetes bacterium]|nr:hypothetical protein [Planctomycetota bacterium]